MCALLLPKTAIADNIDGGCERGIPRYGTEGAYGQAVTAGKYTQKDHSRY